MHYVQQDFDLRGSYCDRGRHPDAPMNLFYAYGLIVRLASMPSALGLEHTTPKKSAA